MESENVSPRERLRFARWVLRGIFTFILLSVAAWFYAREEAEVLLDFCKTGLLPIASFIIGDYFGSRH